MANTLHESVLNALQPSLDANGEMQLETALEILGELDLFEGDDALSYLSEQTDFDIDAENGVLRVLARTEYPRYNGGYSYEEGYDEGAKHYPIPPRDFQYNGKLIKLMNMLADETTPEEGLYFAQFAKAAKDNNLAQPPHEDKLLTYLRLYPKVFTITVDPTASQKIYIKPIKGFKFYHRDKRFSSEKPAFGVKNFHNPQHHTNFVPKDRTLSLYSLSDFAFFPDVAEALKNLAEMAAPTEGCFVIESDVNPYRMFWNKLERDFAEAIRREDSEGEQLFLMSPIGADFPTGFTTAAGVRIFASCEFNKVRNSESYQPWRFTGFYAEEENA